MGFSNKSLFCLSLILTIVTLNGMIVNQGSEIQASEHILDCHKQEVATHLNEWNFRGRIGSLGHFAGSGTKTFNWLPNYIIKYDINRIEGYNKIQAFIDDHNLQHIAVPYKFLYSPYSTRHPLTRPSNKTHVVVAQMIKGKSPKTQPLNEDQTRELIMLIKALGMDDLRDSNIIISDEDNKAYLIDTDKKSFYLGSTIGFLKFRLFNNFEKNSRELLWPEVRSALIKVGILSTGIALGFCFCAYKVLYKK